MMAQEHYQKILEKIGRIINKLNPNNANVRQSNMNFNNRFFILKN